MVKSGLIFAGVMILLAAGAALISPLCVPCIALLAGAAAGYLACLWDKPADNGAAAKRAAGAGAIAGAGALVGHLIGAVINLTLMGPEGYMDTMRELGIDIGPVSPSAFSAGALGSGCCFGLAEVVLMAGLGALGGVLWWQMAGKKSAEPVDSY